MMRRGLLVALAVVVAVNLGVLVGVARNRAGAPDSTVLLDERELTLASGPGGAAMVRLRWNIQREVRPGGTAPAFVPTWIDQPKLEALGFDCSVRPGDRGAEAFYRSVLPRKAIVVVEFAGAAWARHLARWQERARADLERLREARVLEADEDAAYARAIETAPDTLSRLVPIDVGLDPEALRAHYPDGSRYVLVQAVVRLDRDPGGRGNPPALFGRVIEWLPAELPVPRAGRAVLSGVAPTKVGVTPRPRQPRWSDRFTVAGIDHDPRYRAVVKTGHLLQPWIDEVKLEASATLMQLSDR